MYRRACTLRASAERPSGRATRSSRSVSCGRAARAGSGSAPKFPHWLSLGAKNEQCTQAPETRSSCFYLFLDSGHPLGLIFFLGNDIDAAVLGDAGSRRDEMSDDDVLLQATQVIGHSKHRSLCQNASCLLERSRGDEALRGERCLRNSKQERLIRRRLPALRLHASLLDPKLGLVHLLALEEVRVARVLDSDLLQHLPDD